MVIFFLLRCFMCIIPWLSINWGFMVIVLVLLASIPMLVSMLWFMLFLFIVCFWFSCLIIGSQFIGSLYIPRLSLVLLGIFSEGIV